jgi:hypothetical protein
VSIVLFFVLFFAGFVLSAASGIIGIAQSFQESTTWGLLYLFVPFASLVFLIKFWGQREWVRKSFYMAIAGTVLIVAGMFCAPELFSDYAELESQASSIEGASELSISSGNGTSASYSTAPVEDAQ